MAELRLEGIEKRFAGGGRALAGIDLEAKPGELLVLVGPSGCGKSTLLRIVAGLEAPSAGRVLVDARDVTELPPRERDVAMVFQSYALYPHMSVRDNLAFGLRMRGADAARIEERIRWASAMLGVADLLGRRPAELSGGQRQRVALGRALVREPRLFLLDEPLSNLDARLRVETRAEIARLQRELGATMLYVTHDQEEAMTLGHRIAVLREGRLLQIGPPMEVYALPADVFVAGFIGSPPMNLVRGAPGAGGAFVGGGLELEGEGVAPPGAGGIVLGVRPEDAALAPPAEGDATGRVEVVEPLGKEVLVHVRVDGGGATLRVLARPDESPERGSTVGVRLRRDRLHWFSGSDGARC